MRFISLCSLLIWVSMAVSAQPQPPQNLRIIFSCSGVIGITPGGTSLPIREGNTITVTGCNFGASQGEVEVCNSGTHSGATCVDATIRSWSSTEATVTVNTGAFADAISVWLYVRDSTSAVNASGFGPFVLDVCAGSCLYVNNTGSPTCSDATTKANNTAWTPWCTIGRASWGTTSRSSPSSAQAVAAGDTVFVTGSTYTDTSVHNQAVFNVWYRPVNTGTGTAESQRIRFICTGRCRLQAPNLIGPIIGSGDGGATTNNYITWYADIAQGHSWVIDACGNLSSCSSPSTVVLAKQDFGPVVCGGTGLHLEGLIVTSIDDASTDNWNGIKGHGCNDALIRNNVLSGWHIVNHSDAGHAGCFQIYQTVNSIIEHNVCTDSNVCIILKDNDAVGNTGGGNHFRRNFCSGMTAAGVTISHVSSAGETASFFYQNVFDGGYGSAVNIIAAPSGDDFINNVFYNGRDNTPGLISCGGIGASPATAGVRIWNNIALIHESIAHVEVGAVSTYTESTCDHEHNVYFDFDLFFQSDDSADITTFAGWLSSTTNQDEAAPASVDQDPRLANVAGDDFRLCTASGVPHASCAGASPAINRGVDTLDLDGDSNTTETINAGVCVLGTERIGLTTTGMSCAP